MRIADAASMKLLCEINGENSSDYKEMYVDGNCLQLICQQEDYITYKGSIDLPSANAGGEKNTDGVRTSYSMPVTTVTVETYDISDREKPKKTGVYHQDGSYLSSRRTDGRMYLLHHILRKSETAQISYSTMCQGAEKSILPMTIFTFRHRKKIFLIMAGYIWICRGCRTGESGSGNRCYGRCQQRKYFYVSENNIYSATEIWNDRETRTEIVRIGYRDGKFTDGAAGSVVGELHNNFSMNEADDCLRIVTTVEGWDKDYSNFFQK